MNTPQGQPNRSLDEKSVTTLLRLGLGGGRPIDEVIARLEAPDGRAWLARMAGVAPLNAVVNPAVDGFRVMTKEQIEGTKSEAKKLLAPGVSYDDRLRGVLTYFLVLAAGKVQHNAWLTSQDPEQIVRDLGELATVMQAGLQKAIADAAREP